MRVSAAQKKGAKSLINTVAHRLASLVDGRIVQGRTKETAIVTTRGAIEKYLSGQSLFSLPTVMARKTCTIDIGIGIGVTSDAAEAFALQGLEMLLTERGAIFDLGDEITVATKIIAPLESRRIRAHSLETARGAKLPPALVRKLGVIFRELDETSFTAAEFARAYKIQPRSARKLIARLKEGGIIEDSGLEVKSGAGRPRLAYQIYIDRLMSQENAPAISKQSSNRYRGPSMK